MKTQSIYIGDEDEKEGTEIGNGFSPALFLLQKVQQAYRAFWPRSRGLEVFVLRKAGRRYAARVRSLHRDLQNRHQLNEIRPYIHEHKWIIIEFDAGYYEACEVCGIPRYQN